MTTAVRRPGPVTIEGFDAFVEAQADTALCEEALHFEAVEFGIALARIYFDVVV